jgi:hypothetical protein
VKENNIRVGKFMVVAPTENETTALCVGKRIHGAHDGFLMVA